jgi:hypothetical protein
MNIETLLQAAQILESQQSIPPKKRLARGEYDSHSLLFSLSSGIIRYIESHVYNEWIMHVANNQFM